MQLILLLILPVLSYTVAMGSATRLLALFRRRPPASVVAGAIVWAPLAVWLALTFAHQAGKTLSTLVAEPFVLGLIIAGLIALGARWRQEAGRPEVVRPLVIDGLAVAAPIALHLLVPGLAE